MARISGIVLPVAALLFVGFLLAWAGLGWDHQLVTNWVTTTDNSHIFTRQARGSYHHGTLAIVAVSAALGLVWLGLAALVGAYVNWAWDGYPGTSNG